MARRLFVPLLMAIISLVIAVPVLAAYYVDFDVTESNGTSYDMLPVVVTMDIDYLAEHGFISENGLDVRVKNSQGSNVPFMLAEDRVVFASGITGDMVSRFQLTTDNDLIDSFAVCTGDGGYVTISDHANLELGDDFEVEFEGYIDPFEVQTLVEKSEAFAIGTDGSGSIFAEIPYYVFLQPGQWEAEWQEGYSLVDEGSVSWDASDMIYAYAYAHDSGSGADTSEETVVTVDTLSLTDYDTAYCDWYGTMAGTESYEDTKHAFIISTNQMASYTTYDARVLQEDGFVRTVDSLDVSGLDGDYYIRVHVRSTGSGGYPCTGRTYAYKIWFDEGEILTAGGPSVSFNLAEAGEYNIKVWADGTDLKLDVGGVTKDTTPLGDAYVPDNSNDLVISNIPCFNSYEHTTSDTLRITYEPDSIIVGTTLPNEENPGTYYGTITWGSNPAGISVSTSGLSTEEEYYIEDIDSGARDIISPEPAQLISGVDLEKLESNPFHPLVEAIVSGSGGKLTESLVWIGGAWFIFIAALIGGFIGLKQNLVFTSAIGLGLSILFYVMGIFDYWVIIIFAFGAVAAVIHERMPTW